MIDQNNNTQTDNNQVNDIIHHQEFGVKLREARETAGLSTADVSEILKLKEDIIKSLENSQIERLPVSAFTQGYIRSYCRLLKLPADELIDLYNQMVPQQEVPLVQTSGISLQKNSGDGGVKVVTVALVVVGLFMVFLWWLQIEPGKPVVDQTVVSETIDDSLVENQVTESIIEQEIVESPAIVEEPVAKIDLPVAVPKQPEKPKPNLVATEIKKPSEVITKQILPGEDVLVIRSNADSWTEIEDANDQRLLFQLVKAGDFHQLQGRAPFRIFLGNAPSVEITVNDQPIDISKHIRQNNIAHISLKGNATAQTVRSMVQEKPGADDISDSVLDDTNNNEQQAE